MSQTVCVTGAAGRVGRRLVRRLAEAGAEVVAFDRLSFPAPSERVRATTGELLLPDDLDRAIGGCGTVFHLGALTSESDSFAHPERHFETNASGTFGLLSACRRTGVRRIVFTSTSLVYGVPERLPVAESHPTRPLSPYAASKLAAEVALAVYAEAYGFSVDVARLGNVYGADEGERTVIGRALGQACRGETLALADLTPVRDFLHADDAVEGLLRLQQAGGEPGCRIVNLSSGRGTSIREMAEALAAAVRRQGGPELAVQPLGGTPAGRVAELVMDNSRLRERTGWAPSLTIAEGLERAYLERRATPHP